MHVHMSIDEIESQFDSEWVLVVDPETNEFLEVLSGTVACHSKDRDEVYQEALKLRPNRFATVYTGTIPENMALNI